MHFFEKGALTEMSQALGRFPMVPLGFINCFNIDDFAVQAKINIANYLIISFGATKMNTGAIKMFLVQPKCRSRARIARAREMIILCLGCSCLFVCYDGARAYGAVACPLHADAEAVGSGCRAWQSVE